MTDSSPIKAEQATALASANPGRRAAVDAALSRAYATIRESAAGGGCCAFFDLDRLDVSASVANALRADGYSVEVRPAACSTLGSEPVPDRLTITWPVN